MGVGEGPEGIDRETPLSSARSNGGSARRARKTATKSGSHSKRTDPDDVRITRDENIEVPPADNGEQSVTAPVQQRRTRQRSLQRLLAGLRAVNAGDFSVRLTADGEPLMAEIIDLFNRVAQKQARLVDELARVRTAVGREGKMRDRVWMAGAEGQWIKAVDSVNSLITDLVQPTSEVSRVIQAVAEGDLSQKIAGEAQGEFDELKANINQMIAKLRETTERNQEQDWLKTNLAKFSRMMQGQKDLASVSRLIMSELTPLVSAHHGAFFISDQDAGGVVLKLVASYAYRARRQVAKQFAPGEGLVGQAALEKQPILLQNVPGDYIQITSGLGEAPPRNIIVLPILFEGDVKAVIELASFLPFSQIHQAFLDQLAESLGVVLNMIQANMRTEELLEQSQQLTQELQSQSKELQQQQDELKRSNAELEEKAEQLSLSSKYKSEFLANVSHELRTPLNSLLILSKLLAENKDSNLTKKQVEFAQTIYSSGTDLLNLINDILDLSKVEAGKMDVSPTDVSMTEFRAFVDRTFGPVAEQKHLSFTVDISPDVPSPIFTDERRLQQVIKNLLSNAFKFTAHGGVTLSVRRAESNRRFVSRMLDRVEGGVIAFAVKDTGIGIPQTKQQLIFEAFQQADGTTSRKFGGTGLGLSISREIAGLLGGEIRVDSTPGEGSTFTLFLPARYVEREGAARGAGGAGGEGSEATRLPRSAGFDDDRDRAVFAGKRILIVDDDVRNVYSLTSVLEQHGMNVSFAENGKDAVAKLESAPRTDLVLMDVMMPGMDGYETTRAIRARPLFRSLPIIALTAKAMKEDRDKSIAAGVSDYITKPVDNDQLLSLMRVWLYR